MSDYSVVAAVGDALRKVLWQEFQADPVVNGIVPASAAIVFENPAEASQDSSNRLSLWLYHITENEFVKNQPMLPANGADQLRYPPLALNLSYLVTPLAASGDANSLLLGKTMQVLYDNAVTLLSSSVSNVFEELRIVLARQTVEELTSIWQALRAEFRLSIGYQVRVTRVDSLRTLETARIVDRVEGFQDATGLT